MGTNYYIRPQIRPSVLRKIKNLVTEENIYNNSLQSVLLDFKEIHIGKSSYGWQFLFNHNDGKYYQKSWQSIDKFLRDTVAKGGHFVNEYDEEINIDDFWQMVKEKADGFNGKSYYQYECDRYENYKKNPELFKGLVPGLVPTRPYDYTINRPETFSEDNWHLRFADITEFC